MYRFGLLGGTIDYSMSPAIFEAIFALHNIAGSFELFPTMPPALHQRFRQIIDDGVTGLSVTIPFKTAVMPLLDELDDSAGVVGAVNSIHIADGRARGYNTDGDGFAVALRPHAGHLGKGRVVILGSGGAARAVIHSLNRRFGACDILVITQRSENIGHLADSLRTYAPTCRISAVNRTEKQAHVGKVSLIVNCTPLGGPLHPNQQPWPPQIPWPSGAIYYDLNYNDDNAAIAAARKHALAIIDGRLMLVGQAVRSFQIWSGLTIDPQPVFERVFGRR